METKIYAVRLLESLKENDIAALLKGATALRREKYKNTKIKSRAESSLVANALVMFALKDAFHLEGSEIKFGTLPTGKPVLLTRDDVFFSISHSKNMVVCAVSSCPVGIDIEKTRPYSKSVAKRFFTREQLENIENAENKDAAFTREWTVFEAGVKLCGDGIFSRKSNSSFSVDCTYFEDYFITVATPLDN